MRPYSRPTRARLEQEPKALFFAKDFAGNARHSERNEGDPVHPPVGHAPLRPFWELGCKREW